MARQLGAFLEPDTQDDRTQLGRLQLQFEEDWHRSEAAPHIDGLNSLSASLPDESPRSWHVEGNGFVAPGLAASICPRLFKPDSDLVDKDGLVDYRALLDQATQTHPGVFHLREPGILLYAHSFFCRSLSRKNSLNGYLLRSFHEATKEAGVTNARLKLDPDLVGLPASAQPAVMELEYWHGPKYDDAIETIPSGVSEHSNNKGHRTLAGISRTHIWWKDSETRRDDDRSSVTSSVSLAIEWQIEGAAITLSIAGDAARVARLLAASITIVRTGEWPSEWIAQFRDAVLEHASPLDAPVDWPASAVNAARMALERAGRVRMAIDLGANLSN